MVKSASAMRNAFVPVSPWVFDLKPGRNLNGGMASGQRKAKRRTSAESDTHSNSENVSYLSEIRSAYDELVSEGQFVYIATEPLEPEALEEEEEACAHCSVSVSDSHGTLFRRYYSLFKLSKAGNEDDNAFVRSMSRTAG